MEVVTRPLTPPEPAASEKSPARSVHAATTETKPSIAPAPRRPLVLPPTKVATRTRREIPVAAPAPAPTGKRHASPLKLPEPDLAAAAPASKPDKPVVQTPDPAAATPKKPIAPTVTAPLVAKPPRMPADAKPHQPPRSISAETRDVPVRDKPSVVLNTRPMPAPSQVPSASSPKVAPAASPVAAPKAPLPVTMKSMAAAPASKGSSADYASRIAATYDQAVRDGQEREKASAVATNDRPLAKRAELPPVKALPASPASKPSVATVTAKPLVIGEKGNPADRPSSPASIAPAVARDATPGPTAIQAVSRAETTTEQASQPPPVGLSFVIERARRGSSLIDPVVPSAVAATAPAAPVSAPAAPEHAKKVDAPAPVPASTVVSFEKAAPIAAPPAPDSSVASATKATAEPSALPPPPKTLEREKKPPALVKTAPANRKAPAVDAASTARKSEAADSREVVNAGGPVLAGRATKVGASEKSLTKPAAPETIQMAKLEDKPAPASEPAKKAVPKAAASQAKEGKKSPAAAPAAKPMQSHDAAIAQKHLETLRKGGNDQERQKALSAIGQMSHWEDIKGIGPMIRNIAMTDYNTQLRLQAVRMLGQMTRERRMVVEALHISAEYDSDVTIRSTSTRLLEELAATPTESIRR